MCKKHIQKHLNPPVGLSFATCGAPVVVVLVERVVHIIQLVVWLLALLLLLYLLTLATPRLWQPKKLVAPAAVFA